MHQADIINKLDNLQSLGELIVKEASTLKKRLGDLNHSASRKGKAEKISVALVKRQTNLRRAIDKKSVTNF